jgi:hypothetical protein
MEAGPHPRRLLWIAAVAAAAALTSACGGGGSRAAANSPPLVKYAGPGVSFTHPANWKAYPFRWHPPVLHFRPLVYLSTQPVHDPCSTRGNETTCGFPVRRLAPGGVLVTWAVYGIPVSGVRSSPGMAVRVGGRYAKRVTAKPGDCRRIGADRTIQVTIGSATKFTVPTQFTACLRGPGLARNERRIDALLASTRFLPQ